MAQTHPYREATIIRTGPLEHTAAPSVTATPSHISKPQTAEATTKLVSHNSSSTGSGNTYQSPNSSTKHTISSVEDNNLVEPYPQQQLSQKQYQQQFQQPLYPVIEPVEQEGQMHQPQFAMYSPPQNPAQFTHSAQNSPTGSRESFSLEPPKRMNGHPLKHFGSTSSLPRATGSSVDIRSFSVPPTIANEHTRGTSSDRSDSPTSFHGNTNSRSHTRASRSVDLSHLYLLDGNDSTHFTMTNESMSDLSHNLIKQYLGENSQSSLLPRMKTIEMYRKNVKKSNDPKVLFQYAQYMLQTALTLDSNDTLPQSDDAKKGEKNIKKQFLKEAVHYLKKLSDKGYTDAQYLLADANSSGALGKVDNKEAFVLFQGAAKHGHIESAYRTAYCYEEGLGITRDSRRAIEFLKFAAAKNHPSAMYKLGMYSFYSKMGLPDNINTKKSGIQWLSRAVTKANELINAAPYELAKIQDAGFLDIVIPDHKYAMELYVQSASLGHIKAAAICGKAYEMGDEVVPQDADLSIHYYSQAALGGDSDSMLALCAWYLVGNPPNLDKNENEAFQWALSAANLKHVKALYTMGHFYEKGIGCVANIDTAKNWYKMAMDQGDERAKIKLEKLNTPNSAPIADAPITNFLSSKEKKQQGSERKDKKKDNEKDKKDTKKDKKNGKKHRACIIM